MRARQGDTASLRAVEIVAVIAAFWVVFVALNTLRALLLDYPNPGGAFGRRIVVACVGALLTGAMYGALRLTRTRTMGRGIALTGLMSLPAGLIFATVNFLVFDILAPLPGEACEHGLPCTMHDLVVSVSDMLINWSFVFAAWGMLYLSLVSGAQARAADQRSADHREAARLAEIRALRYQVNPHFLFNVLNSLSTLVSRRETEEAEQLIGEIGSFLRHGLATDAAADTSLGDEIDMQRRYLELERRRFPARLSVDIEVARGTTEANVPPLILQPLVENAVKHGVGRSGQPVRIAISAALDRDGRLRIVVEDDAQVPLQPSGQVTNLPSTDGMGIGLRNVEDRLLARFGPSASMRAGPIPTGGYKVELTMPFDPSGVR